MAFWSGFGLGGGGAAAAVIVGVGGFFGYQQLTTPDPETGAEPRLAMEAPLLEDTGAAILETAPRAALGADPVEGLSQRDAPAVATESTAPEDTRLKEEITEDPEPVVAVLDAPDAGEMPQGGDRPQVPEAVTDVAVPPEAAEVVTTLPDLAPLAAPEFDVVRVDAAGSAVVAGKAVPGSRIEIQIDGVAATAMTAGRSGSFVGLFDVTPSDAPQVLSLQSALAAEDGRLRISQSAAQVIIAPFKPLSETAPDVGTEVADMAPQTGETAAPEPVAEGAQPTLLVAGAAGVSLLQPSVPAEAPAAVQSVVIDTISYDETGDVALAGRGTAAQNVRVYLNNAPIKTTAIAVDGTWRTPLPDVDAGVYTLRIDEVDAEGSVISRFETPFQRALPEVVEAATAQAADAGQGAAGDAETGALRAEIVTVQPGFTLWGIADARYGDGRQFLRVYEANAALIKNPDLIYPGQIFTVPE